jgi:hypothetical protein
VRGVFFDCTHKTWKICWCRAIRKETYTTRCIITIQQIYGSKKYGETS